MRDASAAYAEAGVVPVLIVQAQPEQLEESTGPLEGVFAVPDPDSVTHRAIGLGDMPLRKMFSRSLREARKRAQGAGHAQSWSRTFARESDKFRNPGAAVVDDQGRLRWIHRGASVEDLPGPLELLERARAIIAGE